MSDFTAIREASTSLKSLLDKQLDSAIEPQLPTPPITVSLVSPKELEAKGGLSLWLYRVARNPELTNVPPQRRAPDRLGRTPLPLDLFYLLTPVKQDPATDQVVLGRVIQTFHDTPILRGADLTQPLRDEGRELRVNLEPQTLDQLSQVWQALQQPYQLSVSYHVQVIPIDSAKQATVVSPIVSSEVRHSQILTSS